MTWSAVLVPFFAFLFEEVLKGDWTECFTHQVAGFKFIECFLEVFWQRYDAALFAFFIAHVVDVEFNCVAWVNLVLYAIKPVASSTANCRYGLPAPSGQRISILAAFFLPPKLGTRMSGLRFLCAHAR